MDPGGLVTVSKVNLHQTNKQPNSPVRPPALVPASSFVDSMPHQRSPSLVFLFFCPEGAEVPGRYYED